MIVAKRLAALGVTLALIAGAMYARSEWIDGDDSNGDDTTRASVLVCATELAVMCNQVAGDYPDVTVRIANVSTSLTALAPDEMWFTFTPFPQIVTQTRQRARLPEIAYANDPVASSSLVVVSLADRAAVLQATCGRAIELRCLGDLSGSDWETAGGEASWGRIRPAFAPLTSGIGRLGVAAAVGGFFGGAPIDVSNPEFISWARRLGRAVPPAALAGTTAVGMIQVRSSLLDAAVGAAAEVAASAASRFTTSPVGPATRIDLVLAVPVGLDAPSGLVKALTGAAVNNGWSVPGAPGATGEPADANTVEATSQVWEDLT